MNKHAYLIMAHHKFDILKLMLKDLDYELNDIFLHIDRKTRQCPFDELERCVTRGRLIFVKRMDIHWGGFSQIKCILELLRTAIHTAMYSYYHFMVGVEFPLISQESIHRFFNENAGYEFIGFDNYDMDYLERIKYIHIFNEFSRYRNLAEKMLNEIRLNIVEIQKYLNVDMSKKYKYVFKKGNANWSITHNLAVYIVAHTHEIFKIFRHSHCGDELFVHTLVYNSDFYDRVFDKEDEYHSSMRKVTWDNWANRYSLKDVDELINSGRLFARKIDGADAMQVIEELLKKRLI